MARRWNMQSVMGTFASRPRHRRRTASPPALARRPRSGWAGLTCLALVCWCCPAGEKPAPQLALPERARDAVSGSALVQRLQGLDREAREQELLSQIAAGNVPDYLRRLCPVTIPPRANRQTPAVTFYVTPDYLAVGSDTDYFLTPLTAATAQRVADLTGCSLPTPKMVDAIYSTARVRLPPQPLPPGPAMTTVAVFARHNAIIQAQRAAWAEMAPPGALVAGHKKDVVLSAKLAAVTNRVAIYGWHQTNGRPIQPLYVGHRADWVDYSHGIRLVHGTVLINGHGVSLRAVLSDPAQAGLLSDEGPLPVSRYATNGPLPTAALTPPPAALAPEGVESRSAFRPATQFDEQTLTLALPHGVRVVLNAPRRLAQQSEVLLVLYALPNGNTIAQTIGRALKPGDDGHFDLQHIGAQTRFLRRLLPNRAIVVAYLENELKSWPAWRRQHGDAVLPALVDRVAGVFRDAPVRLVLTGHSGGGSFTFGYLSAVPEIPDQVERIALLDSNYAYDTARHAAKLADWLRASERHFLCVLAYNDAVALLEGKPFVSAAGGTWGRSQAMLQDLGAVFAFRRRDERDLQRHTALHGRIAFLLRENPEGKILHTVQVERNGFIHALLTGTPEEGRGYQYLGARAYDAFVARE